MITAELAVAEARRNVVDAYRYWQDCPTSELVQARYAINAAERALNAAQARLDAVRARRNDG